VIEAIAKRGGTLVLTADHGNAEQMLDADGETPFTAHTTAEVPLVVRAEGVSGLAEDGKLADVAPTLLQLLGIEQPDEWTGRSLLVY
jgi:2,3-bisphosphoglycerate-independent phosphoglycerate mutase